MANVLPREKQIQCIHAMVEGNSIRSTERMTGVHRDTIMRLCVRFGNRCQIFLDSNLRDLTLRHIQCDEIWTFCQKKQARLTAEERNRPDMGDIYVFTALDTDTKLLVTYTLGKRTGETTEAFIADLAQRIVLPDDPNMLYDLKPQISTDGWAAYRDSILDSFGAKVQYGTIIKNYANPEVGRYAPPEVVDCERRRVQFVRDLMTICTSHVERHNLTIRTFLKRFTRLALGFSKKLENLSAAVAMFAAYYDFCWRPRFPGKTSKRRVTPAMAAGVVDTLWTLEDLYDAVNG